MLYAHQQAIIDKDPTHRGLFLGTGSGKTRIACLLARGRTLVVCPKTIAEDRVWEREWEELGLDPSMLKVVSKEKFKKHVKKIPRVMTFIGDEAHTLAGVQPSTYQVNYKKYPKTSQIFTATREYLQRAKPKRVYMLTATPIPNPMVVYGLAYLLGHHWNFGEFRDEFYYEIKRNIFVVNHSKKEQLAQMVNDIGEVGKLDDWFDVPDQTYKTDSVELTTEQKRHIKDIRLLYPDPLVQVGKMHQLEQGIYEGNMVKENKTKAIATLADEFKKVVVFAKYTAQIKHYAKVLSKKYNVMTLTGDTKERGDVLDKANEAPEMIFIVQAQISAGWALPHYPIMAFASESYSYIDREQGEGRVQRVNNIKKNLYVTLVAGDVDRKVREIINKKQDFVIAMHAENI